MEKLLLIFEIAKRIVFAAFCIVLFFCAWFLLTFLIALFIPCVIYFIALFFMIGTFFDYGKGVFDTVSEKLEWILSVITQTPGNYVLLIVSAVISVIVIIVYLLHVEPLNNKKVNDKGSGLNLSKVASAFSEANWDVEVMKQSAREEYKKMERNKR